MAETEKRFADAMNNDFNTPLAFTHLYALARRVSKTISRQKLSQELAEMIIQTFRELGGILGILEKEVIVEEKLPKEVEKLIQQREEARKRKDWETADRLRKKVKEHGYLLEDTPEGARSRKISD